MRRQACQGDGCVTVSLAHTASARTNANTCFTIMRYSALDGRGPVPDARRGGVGGQRAGRVPPRPGAGDRHTHEHDHTHTHRHTHSLTHTIALLLCLSSVHCLTHVRSTTNQQIKTPPLGSASTASSRKHASRSRTRASPMPVSAPTGGSSPPQGGTAACVPTASETGNPRWARPWPCCGATRRACTAWRLPPGEKGRSWPRAGRTRGLLCGTCFRHRRRRGRGGRRDGRGCGGKEGGKGSRRMGRPGQSNNKAPRADSQRAASSVCQRHGSVRFSLRHL